ncbi:hypothetical protein VTL71DRAFT_3112, partial [Oculimacula yallundae]
MICQAPGAFLQRLFLASGSIPAAWMLCTSDLKWEQAFAISQVLLPICYLALSPLRITLVNPHSTRLRGLLNSLHIRFEKEASFGNFTCLSKRGDLLNLSLLLNFEHNYGNMNEHMPL